MNENPFYAIMNAESIAFFGASNNPMKMGTIQLMQLIHGEYKGKVFPVHPSEKTVLGIEAHDSVMKLPIIPDLAVLVLPTRIVPDIIEECGKKGIKRAVIVSGGFKERGHEGIELENKLKYIAGKYGIRFVGPNCIGVINAKNNLNFTFFQYLLGEGSMGLLSQSGTYVTQVLNHLNNLGISFSKAISLGNEADIDLVDGIEYLGDDPETKAIALYIETIRRGKKFVEAAKRVSMKKPIVAYYVGGTEAGARSGMSHTGSMGGNDAVHDGMFRQCGIVRAPSIERLYDWAWAMSVTPLPAGRRIAIVSHSGGPVTSMADACSRLGIEVPFLSEPTRQKLAPFVPATGSTANPIDLTFSMNPGVMMYDIPKVLIESGEVDAVLIHGIMGSSFIRSMKKSNPGLIDVDESQMEKMVAFLHSGLIKITKEMKFPALTSSFNDRTDGAVDFLMQHRIPVYPSPERAVEAMAALMQYAQWRKARG